MYRQIATAYFLGAFTFWPIVGISVFLTLKYLRPINGEDDLDMDEKASSETVSKSLKQKQFSLQHIKKLNSQSDRGTLDLESDVEFACYIRLSPCYISTTDPYEEIDTQSVKSGKPNTSSARSSLQKLMSGSNFFSSTNQFATHGDNASNSDTSGTNTPTSSIYGDNVRPKSISKCPRYWAVARGCQLHLFEDRSERKLIEVVAIPHFVISLWPQDLQEFELFYRRYPIVLISRTDPEGLVSLDLYRDPPRDALYIYVENPVEKEDLYFTLIKQSKDEDSNYDVETQQSLGPRDPVTMARPIRVNKAESQQFLSCIWNTDIPKDTQWLNALLGRIFLALKDSKLADDYLIHKFTTKLKPISDSSNIIGEIKVKNIKSGTAAPYFSDIKLKELTPDGNLVLTASVSYNGGFKVILATSVKLAAVTSLTTVEIPVELAATLRDLKGTVLVRVKPAPSERIWYAFETMPEVDLHIEPAVYDTHISLSVVTKFIRSKILDSLKESLVMPYMDDLCFYNTEDCFYRGGIWQTSNKETDPKKAKVGKKDAGSKEPLLPSSASTSALRRSISNTSGLSVANPSISGEGLDSYQSKQDTLSPAFAPRIRNRSSMYGDTDSVDLAEESSASVSSRSTVQRLSNWVKGKRSSRDLKPSSSASPSSPLFEPREPTDSMETDSIFNMSPGSVHRRQRATSTTQVTPANASIEGIPLNKSPNSETFTGENNHAPAAPKQKVRRKPVQTQEDLKEGEIGDSENETETVTTSRVQTESLLKQRLDFEREETSSPERKQTVRRKPVPQIGKNTLTEDIGSLEPSILPPSTVSTNTSNESIKGEISVEPRPLSRRGSLSSLHSRGSSYPPDTNSIRSGGSIKGPMLPPRQRRVVPLSNVAPERDASWSS